MQLPSQAQCGAQQEYQSILGDRLENRSCIPNFCRLEHLLPINRYHAHSASFFHLPAFFFRDAARGYTKFLYCLRAPTVCSIRNEVNSMLYSLLHSTFLFP